MHSGPECLGCAVEQVRRIARLVGADAETEDRAAEHVMAAAKDLDLDEPPSTYTSRILLAAMRLLRSDDPFRGQKQEQNAQAAVLAAEADRELAGIADPLGTALMLAAAGNVIDSGPGHRFSIEDAVRDLRFAHDESTLLRDRLAGAARVMYILDNAGEVMFDELVLKRLPAAGMTIVARSSPILNDVTLAEARALGLDRYGRLIGTGSRFLGVDLGSVSEEFRQAYEEADVVVAKGHANFESLIDDGRDGFYLLKAKCELVARPLGVALGESACYHSDGSGSDS